MILETDPNDWHDHPSGDDVSVCAITDAETVMACHGISDFDFIGEGDRRVAPGSEVFWVGRFGRHDGKQRNLPCARFGHVSMLPLEPILTEEGLRQESFLVESMSLPGSSGSPVFVYTPGLKRPSLALSFATDRGIASGRPHELSPLGERPKLLGVDWAHLHDFGDVLDEDENPVGRVKLNNGMMCVVPAWKIAEVLESPELEEAREREEEERAKRAAESPATPDGSG